MREVKATPNREMAVDWRVSPWRGDGGGAGTVVADDAAQVLHRGEREKGEVGIKEGGRGTG
jgi:hypothetical protein